MGSIREIDILFLSAAATEDMPKLQKLSELYKNGEQYGKAGKVCYDTICTPEGYNALHLAAREGKTEACRFLIENLKFDVNGAIEAGTDGVAKEMYKNGEVYGKAGKVCYDTICKPEGYNALHLAARAGKTEACRFLIENLKFDVNGAVEASTNDVAEGVTALFLSTLNKHQPTTIFLIENGADVNKQTVLGEAPLHIAAKSGSEEMLKLLVSKGADLNAISVFGMPLHFAAMSGNHVILKYLLDLKADPNPSTSYNELTPLFAAVRADARECVKLLLEAGADPNIPCYFRTPFTWAARKLDVEVLEWMLKAGADPNLQDNAS